MSWRDQKYHEFDKTYIEPLEKNVRAALGAMTQMEELLMKVRRDCQ